MTHHIHVLYQHRELLFLWIQREIRVRYKQSVLGIAWAILQPAALAGVFSIVFAHLVRLPSDGVPYPIFAYSALVPWTFIATAVSQGVPSLVNHTNLVTKAAFPKEIIPLGVVGAALVDYGCSFAVFVAMLLLYRVPVSAHILWWPLLLFSQIAVATSVVLLGALLNVFYRDIRFVVPLVVQVWMYATPILYPYSLVPERWRIVYSLNPMVGIIESSRNIFLSGTAPKLQTLVPGLLVSYITLIVAYWLFKSFEPDFADVI